MDVIEGLLCVFIGGSIGVFVGLLGVYNDTMKERKR